MKKRRQRSILGPVLLASILAGGFGYCAGRRGVSKPPGPIVTMLECPDIGGGNAASNALAAVSEKEDEGARRKGSAPSAKPAASKLPALANNADHREELLKYIRENSSALQECAAGQRERLRLTVRLDVGKQGSISRVQIVDDAPHSVTVGQCLQQRMISWKLPEEWVQPKQSLLMSVVL